MTGIWSDPAGLALIAVAFVTYAALVWRRDKRWWAGTAVVAVVLIGLLLGWAEALKGQSWFAGLFQTIAAILIGVGLIFGSVVQAIGLWRPGARWGVLVGFGFSVELAALIGLTLAL